jgi:PIN domain nuclease of toxin-antitoxin system
VALWAITDDQKLSAKARTLINAPRTSILISVVSLWEISIRHGLRRGDKPIFRREALDYFRQAGYNILAIEVETVFVEGLPMHHQSV